jgi:D-glycero-D-manno-heptose 1,7-bisphosphate phosphatase
MQADGYFIDIGIPDDLARAQTSLPRHALRPALFLNLCCIVKHRHSRNEIASGPEWVDGALEALRLATEFGWHVFVLSNPSDAEQRGIAEKVHNAGGTICRYRAHKPQRDTLTDLITAWEINPKTALVIGADAEETRAGTAVGATAHLFPGGNILSFLQQHITPAASQ